MNAGLSEQPGCTTLRSAPYLMSVLDIILCIFIPPLAVLLRKGAGKDFIINLVLWVLLLGIGGVIHAFWLLSRKE